MVALKMTNRERVWSQIQIRTWFPVWNQIQVRVRGRVWNQVRSAL